MISSKIVVVGLLWVVVSSLQPLCAQNSMGVGTNTPNSNAVLELVSPAGNQGFLVPRYTTTQRTAGTFTSNLGSVDNGLMVFDTDEGVFYFWFVDQWVSVSNTSTQVSAGSGIAIDGSGVINNTGDLDPGNEIQDLQLSGDLLSITNNGAATVIDLSPYKVDSDTDDQNASEVAFTPSGNILATNVQAALQELDDDLSGLPTGDMTQSIYDVDSNSKADVADAADSLSVNFIDGFSLAYNSSSNRIEVPTNGITESKIVDSAITSAKLENGAVTGPKIGVLASEGNSLIYSSGAWQAGTVNFLDISGVPVDIADGDNQDAINVPFDNTNLGILAATNVQTAIDALTADYYDLGLFSGGLIPDNSSVKAAFQEIETSLEAITPSPWEPSASNIFYNFGYVGIGNTDPKSGLQISDDFHFFHFDNGLGAEGEIIGENVYGEGAALRVTKEGPSSMILFTQGEIEFYHGNSLTAGSDILTGGTLQASLSLLETGDAEFNGAVEIGGLLGTPRTGMLQYDGGFQGYNGVEWVSLAGLTLPAQHIIDESGTIPFLIQNDGTAGVASFISSNPTSFANALNVETEAEDTNAAGVNVRHYGLGVGLDLELTNPSNFSTAIFSKTSGTGYAGRFEIDNISNNNAAVLGRVDAGGGKAIEGYMAGDGQAARFTVSNPSNGAIAMSVNSDGTNSTAYFSNSNNSTITSTVEISNSGTGAGLTIQNPGGTTSFGDVSFINGDLGIGQFSPSAKLDVVGNTELNGDVTISGNLVSGGAVAHGGIRTISNANYTVLPTDYTISLTGSGAQSFTITLPKASEMPGRELFLVITGASVHYNIKLFDTGDRFARENGFITTNDLQMSQYIYNEWYMVKLVSIGNNWYVMSYLLNGAA